jgi:hypothetical protein
MLKNCPRCKLEKDLLEFNSQGTYCKVCHKEYRDNWKSANPDKHKQAQTKYYLKIRDTPEYKAKMKAGSKEASKKFYAANSEKHKAVVRARKISLKNFVISLKKEGYCIKCGCSDYRCLQYHHSDRETKRKAIALLVQTGCSLSALKNEIAKCVLLCANCHAIEHWVDDGELEEAVNYGYGQGSSNSQFNTYWLTNGILNRKWSDAKGVIPNGFYLGRS